MFEALDKCGAGTVDIGVIVYKRITFDRSGKVIAEKPLLQIATSWDRLRQVLLKVIDRQRYHFGYVFERVEQDGSGVHCSCRFDLKPREIVFLSMDIMLSFGEPQARSQSRKTGKIASRDVARSRINWISACQHRAA